MKKTTDINLILARRGLFFADSPDLKRKVSFNWDHAQAVCRFCGKTSLRKQRGHATRWAGYCEDHLPGIRGKTEVACSRCGKLSQKWNSQIGRSSDHYCSQQCRNAPNLVDCHRCGKAFHRHEKAQRFEKLFCSRKCHQRYRDEHRSLRACCYCTTDIPTGRRICDSPEWRARAQLSPFQQQVVEAFGSLEWARAISRAMRRCRARTRYRLPLDEFLALCREVVKQTRNERGSDDCRNRRRH